MSKRRKAPRLWHGLKRPVFNEDGSVQFRFVNSADSFKRLHSAEVASWSRQVIDLALGQRINRVQIAQKVAKGLDK